MIHQDSYKPEYKEGIIKLLGDREYKRRIWDWQYFENPYPREALTTVVILDDDKIIGFCAALPVKIKFRQKEMMSHWIFDLYVHLLYRGKNVGRRIYQVQKGFELLLSYGISDLAAPIVRKLGWRVNYEIEEYYYQNKITGIKGIIKILIQKLRRQDLSIDREAFSSLSAEVLPVGEILDQVDPIWNQCKSVYPNVIIRNEQYIRWKYADHPLAAYQAIMVRQQAQPAAIAIFRANRKRARLVDYIGPYRDPAVKLKIIEQFIKSCSDSAQLNCISSDVELNTCLRMFGFLKFKRRPRFYVFSPKNKNDDVERDWFIMAGDADDDLLEASKDYYALGETAR